MSWSAAIRGNVSTLPFGPSYGEVRRGADSETEVEPTIVHRVEARLRGELLQLLVQGTNG